VYNEWAEVREQQKEEWACDRGKRLAVWGALVLAKPASNEGTVELWE
jgi:hypothetical protein